MIARLIKRVRWELVKRWLWARYRPVLDAMTSMDQFRALLDRVREPMFMTYEKINPIAEKEFCAALDELKIDLGGKRFLDIGPGCGSSLDVARRRRAARIDFIDYSPFMFTFNRLKGFTGIWMDARRDLGKLPPGQYDLIYIHGTYSADRFILRDKFPILSLFRQWPRLESILIRLERVAASGGEILFCPHWRPNGQQRLIPDVLHSSLARTFQNQGYQALPYIQGHNAEPMFPVTFYKRVAGPSQPVATQS
jgi:hypothetical protein